ncbi:hypothetical protein [Acidovorax sp. A1169]|nr:hypothetical protein [Acidovorax sp. A1169]MDP4074622.1 hypothetical protein [Acidovorax sp. A1169]
MMDAAPSGVVSDTRLLSALLEPIGYIPPAEAEANYYRQFANQATAVVT